MDTLKKAIPQPTLKSVIEDFWNTDNFISNSFLASKTYPTVNIVDQKDGYHLEVSAPGFKKEDFHVSLENGLLVISAESSKENKEENENYLRKEFSTSSFSRSFRLPDDITMDRIKASYEHGLLNISIVKTPSQEKEVREIKIE